EGPQFPIQVGKSLPCQVGKLRIYAVAVCAMAGNAAFSRDALAADGITWNGALILCSRPFRRLNLAACNSLHQTLAAQKRGNTQRQASDHAEHLPIPQSP